MTEKEDQPSVRPVLKRQKLRAGTTRAQAKLRALNCDPMEIMVWTVERLKGEVIRHEKIRSKELVELLESGKPRNYSNDLHLQTLDKLGNLTEKLLRYNYGRAPENVPTGGDKPKLGLTVNLTKKGEVYKAGSHATDTGEDDDFDDLDDVDVIVDVEATVVTPAPSPSTIKVRRP